MCEVCRVCVGYVMRLGCVKWDTCVSGEACVCEVCRVCDGVCHEARVCEVGHVCVGCVSCGRGV